MKEKLFRAIKQFAKRQMTWLRRWERQGIKINWVKSRGEAGKIVREFLKF
jgi:tRNA dimethylallyltransferase